MSAVAHDPLSIFEVELVPMKRRHLRSVLRIETLVYPRPWSLALFLQEISRRHDRSYNVARWRNEVIGYSGLIIQGPEAHVTTIAVDPVYHRNGIGMKLMIEMMDEAIVRGAKSVSLEVRKANEPAKRMYERFGFRPIGVRKGYYVETGEDAIVMWVDGIDGPGFAKVLQGLREVAGHD